MKCEIHYHERDIDYISKKNTKFWRGNSFWLTFVKVLEVCEIISEIDI